MPYGGPIVETDALIGAKCIACLESCQNQHPGSATKTLVYVYEDFVVERGREKNIGYIWNVVIFVFVCF